MISNRLGEYKLQYSEIEKIQDSLDKKRKRLNNKILEQNSNLIKLDNIKNIKDLKSNKKEVLLSISSVESRLEKYDKYFSENTPRLRELSRLQKKYNSEDILDRLNKLNVARNEKSKVKSDLDKIKIIIKNTDHMK